MSLLIHETFLSIQGESTHAGRPCFFIRLSGCNLRCAWCDTRAAWTGGREFALEELTAMARQEGCPLVEVTGGEPLLQAETPALVAALCDAGFEVLVETNGSRDIGVLDARCAAIVDVKCPGSGEAAANDPDNLKRLRPADELKFVLADREDYEFARDVVRGLARSGPMDAGEGMTGLPAGGLRRGVWPEGAREKSGTSARTGFPGSPDAAGIPGWMLPGAAVHFSPVFGRLDPRELAAWITRDRLAVRLGLQWHKYIWGPEATGV